MPNSARALPFSVRTSTMAAVAVLALAAGGCSSARSHPDAKGGSGSSGASSPASPSGAIAVGPGPQGAYTVQRQPAPGTCHVRHTAGKQPLPDPKCTPGATNPKVTAATLRSTICRSGYTKDIRPPVNITGREKKANAASYGYTGPLHDAEYDHLISLQLGGDPNDPRNLWVEPPSPGHRPGAGPNNPKDVVENRLKAAICAGKADLTKAQEAIARDWTTAEAVLGIERAGR
ncbi:hypothetical protein [Streptomyces sp. NRRL S-337]|uniref:hypothetical protein n=1 Tax=Streptomyces sp. NRRL S-337 TaxID=1463900 RepID=UPI0004C7B6D6|nr:hypothetical protein [Streptomyces sp. NRRL S-337]